MKTGEDTIFGSICANSEIWQNRVDHTFDNMVVLNSISLVENDVLIKWTNKVDKTEKPTAKFFWCPYLEVWLPYKAIWLTLLWLQSGPPVYHHQLFSCCYLKGKWCQSWRCHCIYYWWFSINSKWHNMTRQDYANGYQQAGWSLF